MLWMKIMIKKMTFQNRMKIGESLRYITSSIWICRHQRVDANLSVSPHISVSLSCHSLTSLAGQMALMKGGKVKPSTLRDQDEDEDDSEEEEEDDDDDDSDSDSDSD